jgi:hypothetical protein
VSAKRYWSLKSENIEQSWVEEAKMLHGLGAKMIVPKNYAKFVETQKDIYNKWFPEITKKAEQYARIFNVSDSYLLDMMMTEHIGESHKVAEPGCCVIMVKKNESITVGRNFDSKMAAEKISTCIEYEIGGKKYWINTDLNAYKTPMDSDNYRIRPQEGWTDNFYVAINSGPSIKQTSGIAATQVLEKLMIMTIEGKSTADIINYVTEVPINRGVSISVVSGGKLFVVEKSGQKSQTRSSDEVLFSTNHFVGNNMLEANCLLFKKIPFHASFPRYGFIEANLDKVIFSENIFDQIVDLLHEEPLNQNFRDEKFDCVTDWISVLTLGRKSKTFFSPNNTEHREELLLEYV